MVLAAVVLLLMAVAAVLRLPLAATLAWPAALGVLALGGAALTRWAARHPTRLHLAPDGRITLGDHRGRRIATRLSGAPRVLGPCISIPLHRSVAGRRALLVTRDMTGDFAFRRLACRLRTMTGI